MLLLVRHADAGDKRHWERLDNLQPLSAAGQAEAAGLLVRLVADGLMVDQPLVWPKGSTWLLDGADRRFAFGRYLPPLRLVDAQVPPPAPQGATANGRRPTGQPGRRDGTTLPSKIR